MAILDLLRRRWQDEEDEDEIAGATGTDEEESEDEDSSGGLLARFASVPVLGRVLRRSVAGEESDDGGDAEEESGDEDAGPEGGLLGRLLNVVRRLWQVLRRRGNADEDGDDDEDEGPMAGATIGPEAPSLPVEQPAPPEPEATMGTASSAEEAPAPEDAGEPDDNADGSESPLDKTGDEIPEVARRLRQLARSQDNIPAEELVGQLQELLHQIDRRR